MAKTNPLKFRWLHGEEAKKIPRGALVVFRVRYVTEGRRGEPTVVNTGSSYSLIEHFRPTHVENSEEYGKDTHTIGGQVYSYMWIKDKP
jgi:hypothetical protein